MPCSNPKYLIHQLPPNIRALILKQSPYIKPDNMLAYVHFYWFGWAQDQNLLNTPELKLELMAVMLGSAKE